MTRSKDFDESPTSSPILLHHEDISLKTLSWKENEIYQKLKEKNSSFIDQYAIQNLTNKPALVLGINYKDDPAGEITLWNLNYEGKTCSISYWITKDLYRKNITSKAVALVMDYCFSDLGIEEIEAAVQADNVFSINFLNRLGFLKSGYETFIGKDKLPHLHEIYVFVKPEGEDALKAIDLLTMVLSEK